MKQSSYRCLVLLRPKNFPLIKNDSLPEVSTGSAGRIPTLTLCPTPGSSPSTAPAPPPTPQPRRRCPGERHVTLVSSPALRRAAGGVRGGGGVPDTYGEVFQVDHDGEGHPQGLAGRHHTSSQRDDALRREERGRSCEGAVGGGGGEEVARAPSPWGGC